MTEESRPGWRKQLDSVKDRLEKRRPDIQPRDLEAEFQNQELPTEGLVG